MAADAHPGVREQGAGVDAPHVDRLQGLEVVLECVADQDGLGRDELQKPALHVLEPRGHAPQQLLRDARLVGVVVPNAVAREHQLIVHHLQPRHELHRV